LLLFLFLKFVVCGRALQEEGDPLAIDPLDLIDDEQGDDDVDELAQLEEEDNSMFDIGTGMSRSDVKKVHAGAGSLRLLAGKLNLQSHRTPGVELEPTPKYTEGLLQSSHVPVLYLRIFHGLMPPSLIHTHVHVCLC